MFNKSNPPRGLDGGKARSQATEMLADMLTDKMLKSSAPEEIKLGVRIIQQGKKNKRFSAKNYRGVCR